MEARLKQSGIFQNLIRHLKEKAWIDYAALHFDSEVISMQGMDPSILVELSLYPKKLFDSYQCDEILDMDLDIRALSRIFQNQQEDATTRLFIDPEDRDSNILSVFSEFTDRFHQSDVSFWAEEEDRLGIPDTTWDCTVMMPTEKLQSIVGRIHKIGGVRDDRYALCGIRATEKGIFFTMNEVKGVRRIRLTKLFRCSQDVMVKGNKPMTEDAPFSSYYLDSCIGKTHIASQVSLSMKGNDYPMEMDFSIDEKTESGEMEKCGSLKYYIAPEVDEYNCPLLSLESQDHVFEARMSEAQVFSNLIKAVSGIVKEVEMTLYESGIRFCALDRSDGHSLFIDVLLAPDFFDDFRCRTTMRIGADLFWLKWALEGAESEDILTLAADVEHLDGLKIRTENRQKDEVSVYEISACEVDDTPCKLPECPNDCSVTMPAKLFEKILQDLKGPHCTISITETGILFESGTTTRSVLDTKHCEVVFDVRRPAGATFHLWYLKQFTLTNFASAVKLSMGPHMPLALEYRSYLSESSVVKYFVSSFNNDCEDSPGPVLSATEVDLLSSRLQSCKEVVTDLQKTRAAKKPPARKRKRAESKEKKPARKRAIRTKPKKCSVCKLIKSYEEYFPAQLTKTTKAKCIDCMVVDCRSVMMAWREPSIRGRWEEAERREEVSCMRSLRCERYECPIFFEYGQGTIPENLQASFLPAVPDVGKLFGSYDLVYVCSDASDGTYKQHAISGALCLESRNDGLLRGSFQISPVISDFVEPGARSFAIAQSTSDSAKSFEIPIHVLEPTAGASLDLSSEGGHSGTVRVLAQRTATGWFPMEYPGYKRLISFDTVDEAEVLMKRREEAFLANSWINNHLSFPTELALKIHEYVAFRPPFAFFFEKGDLWITLNWKKANGSVWKTIFVARRRAV